MVHAATAGKMVLAAGGDNGWFRYMVPKFSLGRLCDPQDPERLAETLDPALHEAEGYKLSAAAKRCSIARRILCPMEARNESSHGKVRRC